MAKQESWAARVWASSPIYWAFPQRLRESGSNCMAHRGPVAETCIILASGLGCYGVVCVLPYPHGEASLHSDGTEKRCLCEQISHERGNFPKGIGAFKKELR